MEEEEFDYDSDATLDIDDPSLQLADKGFPLRRMSEGYALVLMRQMREGKFSTQDAEFGSQRSLKGHRWSICVPHSHISALDVEEPEDDEEFGDDESEGSGELEEEDWDDLDSDSPTSFLSFGDEDDSAENIRERLVSLILNFSRQLD